MFCGVYLTCRKVTPVPCKLIMFMVGCGQLFCGVHLRCRTVIAVRKENGRRAGSEFCVLSDVFSFWGGVLWCGSVFCGGVVVFLWCSCVFW